MKNTRNEPTDTNPSTSDQQGVDKAPGEERGKAEKVSNTDLKGKKVDGDPETDQPVDPPAR